MFQTNDSHLQRSLFNFENQLSKTKQKKLESSKESYFYEMIFSKINEQDFSILYSSTNSRPNAPVNSLVASMILLNQKGWTTEELFNNIDFNLLTRTALGLDTFEKTPFCPATYFNFQNRLMKYYNESGKNLFEQVFDKLTSNQLKSLKIKTNIQRTDSFMALSNIQNYSRVQLVVEVLIRLYRELKDSDKEEFDKILKPYISKSSQNFIYTLTRDSIPKELKKLGEIYHIIYEKLNKSYENEEIFQIFKRVYEEHFEVGTAGIEVKEANKMKSGSLQSPDDIDATYRNKSGKKSKGQSINVTETINPENEINLITDVSVHSNNTDDSKILNKRLESIKEKTPDLEELHTDGAYGSSENDKKLEELEIVQIQTAVRGNSAKVKIEIKKNSNTPEEYTVSCPNQEVISNKTPKRHQACFDKKICDNCELSHDCPAIEQKKCRCHYFKNEDYLLDERKRNIEVLPDERKNLRANIEATVKEYTKGFNHKGKLKIRGQFKTMLFAFGMSIAINFGRIYRYAIENNINPLNTKNTAYIKHIIAEYCKKIINKLYYKINLINFIYEK
jgi:hypothetical protein